MPIVAGTYLGPYEIISALGKGGMGEVYRAKDTRLERQVAIKVVSEHLEGNEKALMRFEREAKTLAALSHPNIVAIYDIGTDRGVSFVAMELLEGESLRNCLERSPLPWASGTADRICDCRCIGRKFNTIVFDWRLGKNFIYYPKYPIL